MRRSVRCESGQEAQGGWGPKRGTTLIEALVALAVVGAAIAGTSAVIAQSFDALALARDEARAREALTLHLGAGIEGSGPLDWPGVREAEWSVTRRLVARRTLAGTTARWERVEASVTWQRNGILRELDASRLDILPDQATP